MEIIAAEAFGTVAQGLTEAVQSSLASDGSAISRRDLDGACVPEKTSCRGAVCDAPGDAMRLKPREQLTKSQGARNVCNSMPWRLAQRLHFSYEPIEICNQPREAIFDPMELRLRGCGLAPRAIGVRMEGAEGCSGRCTVRL